MKIGAIDTDRETLIIAEVGNNHEGDPAVASRLIGLAAEAGVQAVKFQTFRTESFVSPQDSERFARMKRFELSQEVFARLAEEAHRAGLLFISTPLDLPSAHFLAGIADAIKIASGDNTFYPLIETVAKSGKPMIVSGGLADLAELDHAVSLVGKIRRATAYPGDFALLHCVSAYPVPPEEANLSAVRSLARRYPDLTIGYSDHTQGTRAAILAVAAGARIVEKHFTLDRNYSSFRDHQLSADPAGLKQLVEEIREAETLLGDGVKKPSPTELASLGAIRRSIAAARDLAPGQVVGPEDIVWLRPGTGFPPGEEREVLGRTMKTPILAGALFSSDHLA